MNIKSLVLFFVSLMLITSTSFAQHNYSGGGVSPRGNINYGHHGHHGRHHHHHRNGCFGVDCTAVVIGAVVIGTAGVIIANQKQSEIIYVPQPIYTPQPQIVYVPSNNRCDGSVIINSVYHCPFYR